MSVLERVDCAYISAWISRFASVTEIIKYVEKLWLPFTCLVFLEPYVKRYTSSKRVLLTNWTAVFSQVWRSSIFKFCVYKLAEAVRYLKFKWEFVIIGRGCLVLLKFKSSLFFCGINLPCVNRTSLHADSQWIIILKTFELVTLSFSQFHAQRNWRLTHALHIFNQYMRLLCCFWSLI